LNLNRNRWLSYGPAYLVVGQATRSLKT
jgi:hypothetical protein